MSKNTICYFCNCTVVCSLAGHGLVLPDLPLQTRKLLFKACERYKTIQEYRKAHNLPSQANWSAYDIDTDETILSKNLAEN